MKILRIDASADIGTGQTRRLADQIIDGLRKSGQTTELVVRDLSSPLPQVTREWIEANRTLAEDRSPAQIAVLALSESLIAEIEAADLLIVGLPLYNFSVPASLKLWIDLVCRARRTFAYAETGPKGLIRGKRAIVCFASGGTVFGSAVDFGSSYLRHILGFIGVHDVGFVTAAQHFKETKSLGAAREQARRAVATLLAEPRTSSVVS